jgi:gamma-glutamyl-gamma-aminobutyrate hydrolase PuuD
MKIYIVGGDVLIEEMYRERGHEVTNDFKTADIIQFTGGADVSPSLYGENKHPETSCSPMRDQVELEVYKRCLLDGKPMVGICRGGQFLNVMNGGKMYQHVDGHDRTHELLDSYTNQLHVVTSTHHQMMIPAIIADNRKPVVVATACEASMLEKALSVTRIKKNLWTDIEVVWYPETNSLCFQPHPEYGLSSCTDYFFELLERYGYI